MSVLVGVTALKTGRIAQYPRIQYLIALLVKHSIYLLFAFLLLLWPSPSEAQNESRERARILVRTGDTNYRLARFKEALDNYREALVLRSHPGIIFNIAQCYRQLGDWDQALFYYRLYLSEAERRVKGTTPSYVEEVLEHIRAIQARKEQALKEAEAQKAAEALALAKKQEAEQREAEAASRRKAEARRATVALGGVPLGARVFIDGQLRSEGPLALPLELPPGPHQLLVVAAGHQPFRMAMALGAGQALRIAVELKPTPSRNRLWLALGISTGILAAGSLCVGAAFDHLSTQEIDGSSAWAEKANIGLAGYIAASSLAVASAVSFVLYARSNGPRDEKPSQASDARSLHLGFLPGPSGAAMGVHLRY